MKKGKLQAGRAWCGITPEAGTHLAGSGRGNLRGAESVMDPLYAKALVLESGGWRIGFVALDVTIITDEYTERIRAAAEAECGIEPGALMVHATQTHSAPAMGYFLADRELWDRVPPEREYILGGQRFYADMACERAIEALKAAVADLQPVQAGFGQAARLDLAHNRRAVMRDGGIAMPGRYHDDRNPTGPTAIQYLEGPTDPEIGVFALRTESLEMRSMILHYTCHPVSVFCVGLPAVSADWPGAWCRQMQKRYGPECGGLVLNGCCGDVNPWPPFEPGFVLDHERQGRELARSAFHAAGTK
jgi:neutral ceramidase